MIQTTPSTSISDIRRDWHIIDVSGQILGRSAGKIALLLRGKSKPYFVSHLDCGDYVVVINAKTVRVTGKKEDQKEYQKYSGYPGGLKRKPLSVVRREQPERIIREAVYGMLPKNKLRDQMMKRLYVFPDAQHPYQDQITKTK